MQYVYNFLGYDIKEQLLLTLYALMLGAMLGVLFDVLRFTRTVADYSDGNARFKLQNKCVFAICLIEDIFFFVFSAVILVLFCFKANGGSARGYILFGALVGFTLYFAVFGRLTSLASKTAAKIFYKALKLTKVHIAVPTAAFLKRVVCACYMHTVKCALDGVLRRIYTRKMKKMSRELTHSLSRLYINKRKDDCDEAISYADAGKACSFCGFYNINSYFCHSTDRV